MCSSHYCSLRKEVIETGGYGIWWTLSLRTGEIYKVKLKTVAIAMTPQGSAITVFTKENPSEERQIPLADVKDLRPCDPSD